MTHTTVLLSLIVATNAIFISKTISTLPGNLYKDGLREALPSSSLNYRQNNILFRSSLSVLNQYSYFVPDVIFWCYWFVPSSTYILPYVCRLVPSNVFLNCNQSFFPKRSCLINGNPLMFCSLIPTRHMLLPLSHSK